MPSSAVVAEVPWGEGPVWDATRGTLLVTQVSLGRILEIGVDTGRVDVIAHTLGGPNGAKLTTDGGLVIAQNGGIDPESLRAMGVLEGLAGFGIELGFAPTYTTPSLQLVDRDREVTTIVAGEFRAPNDLSVAEDGTLYFTDPPAIPPPAEAVGRVWSLSPGGALRVVADHLSYPNGLLVDLDGSIVVVEQRGLLRLWPDGGREWVVRRLGEASGDGMCLDVDGRYYVACSSDGMVRVIEADGTEVDQLPIEGGCLTNVCFGGPDLRTLFVTELAPGRVHAFEGMPAAGLALVPWPGVAAVASEGSEGR